MTEQRDDKKHIAANAAIFAAVAVLYSSVLLKLVTDWSSDENYSHGLLVPFVIGLIVWLGWSELQAAVKRADPVIGIPLIAAALLLLFAGTLGAELFTQRVSLVLMLAGVLFFLWGRQVFKLLLVPFALLLLSIPIPQIIFNKIAFPLQLLASQAAVWGIRLLDVPTLRKGNVIDILPQGSTQMISLEVVEACSGIRSLMTLITLALVLVFFTRNSEKGRFLRFERNDVIRAVVLMIAAVPIAVFTNSARVTGTGLGTYYYGKQATSPFWHDASGWAVYAIALLLLFAVNIGLKRLLDKPDENVSLPPASGQPRPAGLRSAIAITLVLAVFGVLLNWYAFRSEAAPERRPLSELPKVLGEWRQRGDDFKMGEAAERILRATDYTMREYTLPDGRIANIYVGYFASQRTGTTIHSPQNCLPGSGWIMKDPGIVTVTPTNGIPFEANRYIIENGIYKEVMLYWYQGRGRTETSEYKAKLDTVVDSVSKRRTDGSMVRVMTTVGYDEAAADRAALDLAAKLADELPGFIPD